MEASSPAPGSVVFLPQWILDSRQPRTIDCASLYRVKSTSNYTRTYGRYAANGVCYRRLVYSRTFARILWKRRNMEIPAEYYWAYPFSVARPFPQQSDPTNR